MILTGREIEKERANGRITIEPFTSDQVNPNSYNFRLGATLRVYREDSLDPRHENPYDEITIPEDGYVLEPRRLYLAHTVETLGSDHYAPTFAARSSIARLGIFIHLSSGLGDIGYKGQWTLQLYTLNRVRLYPGMNIGQMMWWRPQGDIELYDGKYQGASGPRSSDIHIDFDKQVARRRFPGLRTAVTADEVGPKFAALAARSARHRVPAAMCLPARELADALTDEQRAALAEAFSDLRATVGAFYAESVARIHEIGSAIRMPEATRALLRLRLKDVFGDLDAERFAVRSSGLDEDSAGASLAGVHDTVLGVTGFDAVVAAVERCWASHYQATAVAARVRAGDHDPRPRLAVVVQRMIRPRLAGVAFTGLDPAAGDQVVVEYVEGLADRLVAGLDTPVRADSTALAGAPHEAVLTEVCALAADLRDHAGHHVDVEWAADDEGVHLLQVRPLTATNERARHRTEPVAETRRLYFDDLPADFDLGDVAAVYAGYTAKRGPVHRLARENGVATGAGWVLRFNGRGLADQDLAARLRGELATGAAAECVLDLGDSLRQIVVPKDEVLPRLAQITASAADGSLLHAAVVRDYVRGELGVISHPSGDGLIVEFTPEGLMALNRGTAGGRTITVTDVRRPPDDPGNTTAPPQAAPLLPHLPALARFTAVMRDRYGPTTLEWVYEAGTVWFVDYSVLGAEEQLLSTTGGVQISPGTAQGPLLRLEEDELLGRLSIGPAVSIDKSTDVSEHEGLAAIIARVAAAPRRPIVHTSRPYAVLSVLIGHVAGFVFDQGSALGHLAILLREAGVPAVAAPDLSGTGEATISGGSIVLSNQSEEIS
ncbi:MULTISPECIES: dCTP deaminase domain-containing protein [unclassified Streptomyces]|uniref:dCTP deaminase domain-containing protein n=1 Tax=unclassified Streptomyces TaxID=2593676 RepID=UPI002E27AE82|nr:PEP/pyruvate-binding domain-containing protein [Streptomyces sp. NBC_00223]